MHTSFNQAVAATGRLSSSDPNLQNIPIRTDLGREIRRAFIADPGFVLISADYSQIELRVLAHLAEEDALIEAFRRGEDIHDRTALKVFGPNSGLDKHELRRRAKIINYALLYGKTAFTLARDIGVTPAVAQEFIDAYFGGFPRVRTFIDSTIEQRADEGVRRNDVRAPAHGARAEQPQRPDPAGRRADDGELSHSGHGRGHPEAAPCSACTRCFALTEQRAEEQRARMILTVHDELLIESPEDSAAAVAEHVREAMEGAAQLAVPLTVDVGIGPNWREANPDQFALGPQPSALLEFTQMPEPVIIPRSDHPISRQHIDADALKVLYRLRQFDHIAYLVGGSVRDLLLGRTPKDFDIGTSAHPYQVKRLFRNCWIIGRRFRLAHVKFGLKVIEVATFRRQIPAGTEEEPAAAPPVPAPRARRSTIPIC